MATSFDSPWSALRPLLWPLVAAILTVPITIYATARSVETIGRPFPGFLVLDNRVISNVSGYEWPRDHGKVFHSLIRAVDGQAVGSSAEVYSYVASRPVHTPVTYLLSKDGKDFQYTVETRLFTIADYAQTFGILLFFGLISLSFALVVGFMQPRTSQARVYLLSGAVAAMYPITGTLLYQPHSTAFSALYLLAESFFPATWIHLALVFPVARRFDGASRLWRIVPYLVSAVLAIAWMRGYFGNPPSFSPLHATSLYTAVAILFFYGAMIHAYRENRDPTARSRVKVTFFCLILATLMPLIVFANRASSSSGNVPIQFALVLSPIFYASVAYSIAKHDLFDVDRFVRQSFVYGLLSVILLSTYAVVLGVAMRVVPSLAAENQALLSAAFVLLVAFGLDPLRRAVQRIVDRAYYRSRPDYRATIRQLSELMTTLLDQREIAEQVTRVAAEAMQLQSIAVAALDAEGKGGSLWSRVAEGRLVQREVGPALATLSLSMAKSPAPAPASTISGRLVSSAKGAAVASLLAELQANLVLPLISRGNPVGVLVMGSKRSGLPFSADDLDLLRTLAHQVAIAIQNARSYQVLEELTRDLDNKVREQTEQLRASNKELSDAYDELKEAQAQLIQSEKLASLGQLVAGVAHELNNPASFVHGALANLEEYVQRFTTMLHAYEQVPISDPEIRKTIEEVRENTRMDYLLRETPDLLRISGEGTERIKHIIDDLRVFARADRGDRTLTDVALGLDSTIRLLSHRIDRAGISLRRNYLPGTELEANAGQLNQVWMNLLSNAIDAVEGRDDPEIRVTVRNGNRPPEDSAVGIAEEAESGFLEVEIADNGSGIDDETKKRLFEPFFTTKPSGKGTGLGLSIVYGAVKSHGGTIDIDSKLERGTVVTVYLPVVRRSPAA